tara:strand:+ start:299 stop:574 length:276 start_codon:yes stop_codon:yes gene_type:complete
MAKEISENTVIGLSLKSISAIAVGVGILVIGYFDLQAGISEAKLLPPPEVGRMEYDLKDQLIRETIMNTQQDVGDIKNQLDKMEKRLFEMK